MIKIYVARPSINERALRLGLVIAQRSNKSCKMHLPRADAHNYLSATCSIFSCSRAWRTSNCVPTDGTSELPSHRPTFLMLRRGKWEWRNGNHTQVSDGMLNDQDKYVLNIQIVCQYMVVYAAPAQVAALQGWNSKQQSRMREQRFTLRLLIYRIYDFITSLTRSWLYISCLCLRDGFNWKWIIIASSNKHRKYFTLLRYEVIMTDAPNYGKIQGVNTLI